MRDTWLINFCSLSAICHGSQTPWLYSLSCKTIRHQFLYFIFPVILIKIDRQACKFSKCKWEDHMHLLYEFMFEIPVNFRVLSVMRSCWVHKRLFSGRCALSVVGSWQVLLLVSVLKWMLAQCHQKGRLAAWVLVQMLCEGVTFIW